jgi:hypothetical protein
VYRILKDGVTIIDVAEADEVERAIRALRPGRYDIGQFEQDTDPPGRIARHWGIAFKRQDGTVLIKWDTLDD